MGSPMSMKLGFKMALGALLCSSAQHLNPKRGLITLVSCMPPHLTPDFLTQRVLFCSGAKPLCISCAQASPERFTGGHCACRCHAHARVHDGQALHGDQKGNAQRGRGGAGSGVQRRLHRQWQCLLDLFALPPASTCAKCSHDSVPPARSIPSLLFPFFVPGPNYLMSGVRSLYLPLLIFSAA